MPETIAALHARMRTLQQRLDNPDLFASDRKAFDQASAALAAAQSELAAAEEKWLELEQLREDTESG